MRSMHSWEIGYEAGVKGEGIPPTPAGGDEAALAHGYAAGEEVYLASIRSEEADTESGQPAA